jgi:integrase
VIFAAFTGLRWGELVALRLRDVDLGTGVVARCAKVQDGERVQGWPKSDAGCDDVGIGRGTDN